MRLTKKWAEEEKGRDVIKDGEERKRGKKEIGNYKSDCMRQRCTDGRKETV